MPFIVTSCTYVHVHTYHKACGHRGDRSSSAWTFLFDPDFHILLGCLHSPIVMACPLDHGTVRETHIFIPAPLWLFRHQHHSDTTSFASHQRAMTLDPRLSQPRE